MAELDAHFLRIPLAHRGLHDRAEGVIENSRSAFAAAIAAGYGIELDVQMSRHLRPIVFHDENRDRLTEAKGAVRSADLAEMAATPLRESTDCPEYLGDILELVAGRVPLLVEIKDQDGSLGRNVGDFLPEIAMLLRDYAGPLAVMSFNPYTITELRALAPDLTLGLTTDDFSSGEWSALGRERATRLNQFTETDFEPDFISHNKSKFAMPVLAPFTKPKLCWTIRSEAQEIEARRYFDNITFEGFAPNIST